MILIMLFVLWYCCYFLPSPDVLFTWLSLLGTLLSLSTPQVPGVDEFVDFDTVATDSDEESDDEESDDEESDDEESDDEESDNEESDEDLEAEYWEQICYDVTHGILRHPDNKALSQFVDAPSMYYPGEQPSTHEAYGPLIASSAGKQLLDVVVQSDLKWTRLDRLNRFTILNLDGTISDSVRSFKDLFDLNPTLAPIVIKWYGAPWFMAGRPLDLIRKELTTACPGLRHLEFISDHEDIGQHSQAPPTLIFTAPAPKNCTNWRTQELLCCCVPDGWYLIRTVYDKTLRPKLPNQHGQTDPKDEMERRVYFYVSFCSATLWTDYEPDVLKHRLHTWGQHASQLICHKLHYMIDDLCKTDFHVRSLMSNQWMLLILP
jgi:hypothetical protein